MAKNGAAGRNLNKFEYSAFAQLPYGEKSSFLVQMQSVWKRTVLQPPKEWSDAALLKLVREHAKLAQDQDTFLARMVVMCFRGTSDSLNISDELGMPRLHATILGMADLLFKTFRPLLGKHGFSDDLAGYLMMDDLLRGHIISENQTVIEVLAKTWWKLCFGPDRFTPAMIPPRWQEELKAEIAGTDGFVKQMIWDAVSRSYASSTLVCTAQSYLHHVALPPVERRQRSCARTIAFVEALLGPLLSSLKGPVRKAPKQSHTMKPSSSRIVWLLGATETSEASWARAGFFDDAGSRASVKEEMHIHLIGTGPFGGEWPCGKDVTVFAHTWEEMSAGEIPDPLLVFCCNTGLGTLSPKAVEPWIHILVDLLIYPCKQGAGVAVVLTCRCEEEARGERALLACLGARPFFPSPEKRHVRNLYSGMAGDPNIHYDDNGWLTFISGSDLEDEKLLALASNSEALCQAAMEAKSLAMQSSGKNGSKSATSTEGQKNASEEASRINDESGSKVAAVFWGIVDLKYDPTKPLQDLVKVLETGDGRASKFSGYGAAIKETFQEKNKLEDTIHRSVMVESKKLTHDIVNACGYAHLQPRQGCFPKAYTAGLGKRIQDELALDDHGFCILKLSNRARGCGIVPLRVSELDEALRILLSPPENLQQWLTSRDPQEARKVSWGSFEEQLRHWWSNECPCFLVENYCMSMPLVMEIDGVSRELDGTLRVGFLLHKDPNVKLPDGWVIYGRDVVFEGSEESPTPEHHKSEIERMLQPLWSNIFPVGPLGGDPLRVQWLGGYWKLPLEGIDSPDLRARTVSVAKRGTAPVAENDLHRIYAALGDSMQRMFAFRTATQPASVMKRYEAFPELAAFSVARLACSMRLRDMPKSLQLLGFARDQLAKLKGGPCDQTRSYVDRNLGVSDAMRGKWDTAGEFFGKSLASMPANATSRYLLGMYHLNRGEARDAIKSMEESLHLDPDFKAPFVNIAVAWLQLKLYAKAAEASEAGLIRHPHAPQCLFNLGLANFGLACMQERDAEDPGFLATEFRNRALSALSEAKEHIAKEQIWTEYHDDILAQLQHSDEKLTLAMDDLPCKGWRVLGWRP